MTNKTKVLIDNMTTIGYWSELGGVEVKDIILGIEERAICISNAWYGKRSYHNVCINYTKSDRPYIKIHNHRLYLDECLRDTMVSA